MPHAYVFADEAGDFKFSNGTNISKYFILCTVKMDACQVGASLLDLRRAMLMDDVELSDQFHATKDSPAVRNQVYRVLQGCDFRIDATILEKRKARPDVRRNEATFYKYAWYYHAKYFIPRVFRRTDSVLITAAALDTRAGKAAFKAAFNDVVAQTCSGLKARTWFPPSSHDPCLQVADYCAWAIQRKWERDDRRWYDLIRDKIRSEYDLWAIGTQTYY